MFNYDNKSLTELWKNLSNRTHIDVLKDTNVSSQETWDKTKGEETLSI